MPKLPVKIVKSPEAIREPGTYAIKKISPPQDGPYGQTVTITAASSNKEERIIRVPYKPETSDNSNLGRLMKAFGPDTDSWPGRSFRVSIEDGRRRIEPVTK